MSMRSCKCRIFRHFVKASSHSRSRCQADILRKRGGHGGDGIGGRVVLVDVINSRPGVPPEVVYLAIDSRSRSPVDILRKRGGHGGDGIGGRVVLVDVIDVRPGESPEVVYLGL